MAIDKMDYATVVEPQPNKYNKPFQANGTAKTKEIVGNYQEVWRNREKLEEKAIAQTGNC